MTKIIKAKYKLSRRQGKSAWGDSKDSFNKGRTTRPGKSGTESGMMSKKSDYGVHFGAKQLLKGHYGRINERQFRNIFTKAAKMRGNTGENFVALLESRLDVAIYRMTIAASPFAARQLVSHGHVLVNGKRVNIPSYKLSVNDEIEIKAASKELPVIREALARGERKVPDYYSLENDTLKGKFLRVPLASEVPYPFDPEIHLVIELYSK